MNDYYSDRINGHRQCVKEDIDKKLWHKIWAKIKKLIDDGSFGYKFPAHCQDGNAVVGTNCETFWHGLSGEIPDITCAQEFISYREQYDDEYVEDEGQLPTTYAILDLIEFTARNIALPIQGKWHSYLSHHHISFDRDIGLEGFIKDINRIFSRNGIAYKLSQEGKIMRTLSAPMAAIINTAHFRTDDDKLDEYLNRAVEKYLSPELEARQDALEKLWDAFERLKTIEDGEGKKKQAEALITKATNCYGTTFCGEINEAFKTLTELGNNLYIRHSETNKEDLFDDKAREYLFMRMFSLIYFVLAKTERLDI